jgi:two-component system OmpR family response regulator
MNNEAELSKRVEPIILFLVDDDIVYLKSLELEFKQNGDFVIETFTTGEACLEKIAHLPDVVILDYMLNGVDKNAINGIETLDRINEYNPEIAVVMLSSQDKIEVAVDCMHHKAFDYVVKSETAFVRLQRIINNIFEYRKLEKELIWYMDRA